MEIPGKLVLLISYGVGLLGPQQQFLSAQPGPASNSARLILKGDVTASHISSDGRYVLYTDWISTQLCIRDLNTGTDRQLTIKDPNTIGGYPGKASISPDNQRIAYNWYTSDALELRMIPFSGGEPHRIEAGGDNVWLKDWTADGKELLVVKGKALEQTGELGFLVDCRRVTITTEKTPSLYAV